MRLSKIKSIAIAVLAVSAVYLTEQLWFEKISSQDFLPSFMSGLSYTRAETGADKDYLVMPMRIVTDGGSGMYSIKYNQLSGWAGKAACDSAITAALKNGSAGSASALDWTGILSRPCFIYQYGFSMPADAFVLKFKQKNGALTSRVKNFEDIAVFPAAPPGTPTGVSSGTSSGAASGISSESVDVVFIDQPGRMMYVYEINGGQLAAQVWAALDGARRAGSFLYVSTSQSKLSPPDVNMFIPQSPDPYTYVHLSASNPYSGPGGVLYRNIIPLIGIFFDKPSSQWANNPDNYTFSDGSNFVRYYPSDVLEYDNYSVPEAGSASLFADDYGTAVAMISKDTAVTNEYYLASCEESGARRVFSFDYAVNDFPVLVSDTFAQEIGLKHAIEVTVEQDRVVKYKKLVYNFSQGSAVSSANLHFQQAFDSIARQSGGQKGITFDSVNIGYKAEKGSDIKLNWFIGVNSHMFVKGVE